MMCHSVGVCVFVKNLLNHSVYNNPIMFVTDREQLSVFITVLTLVTIVTEMTNIKTLCCIFIFIPNYIEVALLRGSQELVISVILLTAPQPTTSHSLF